MRWVSEFRDPVAVRRLAESVARVQTRQWTLMEVCGGQTHAIVRFGLDALIPGVELLHGPGCPVCVTPVEQVDRACLLAGDPSVILCSYGDMLRVPGSAGDLWTAKSRGGDVRVLYSPLDALALARQSPDRQVVFFAVGFETTAPGHALAVRLARAEGLGNFSLLVSHVLVPPAMETILGAPGNRVQGFLAAGHVCTVVGSAVYEPLASRYHVPIVVTGFEPADLLTGVLRCVIQLEEGRAQVENAYERVVRREGNREAQQLVDEVFEVCDRDWRGLGSIPASGLRLRESFAGFDAERRFRLDLPAGVGPGECRSGEVLRGLLRPVDCPAFGTRCTPEHPLGATMVSTEGACAAYYRYRGPAVAGADSHES